MPSQLADACQLIESLGKRLSDSAVAASRQADRVEHLEKSKLKQDGKLKVLEEKLTTSSPDARLHDMESKLKEIAKKFKLVVSSLSLFERKIGDFDVKEAIHKVLEQRLDQTEHRLEECEVQSRLTMNATSDLRRDIKLLGNRQKVKELFDGFSDAENVDPSPWKETRGLKTSAALDAADRLSALKNKKKLLSATLG